MGAIITVEGLSKKYRIKHRKNDTYPTLRDTITSGIKNIFRFGQSSTTVEELWALKDASFEVMRGERIGIIGRNGAGKSTLLKILSRVVSPTSGRAILEGRIASLLEVGTGFHPELSGRENIFLNGVLMGMSKKEIEKKFDAIVDFSEIEKFLDTPVKRYSSGMFVRLAFSVAAHMEPDILIIDEVLAVGDASFQKKSLQKMEAISNEEGRTILFVSHNLTAMEGLCPKAIYMQNGTVKNIGNTADITSEYLSNVPVQITNK